MDLLHPLTGDLFPHWFTDSGLLSSYKPGKILLAMFLTLSLLALSTGALLQPLTGDFFLADSSDELSLKSDAEAPAVLLVAVGILFLSSCGEFSLRRASEGWVVLFLDANVVVLSSSDWSLKSDAE